MISNNVAVIFIFVLDRSIFFIHLSGDKLNEVRILIISEQFLSDLFRNLILSIIEKRDKLCHELIQNFDSIWVKLFVLSNVFSDPGGSMIKHKSLKLKVKWIIISCIFLKLISWLHINWNELLKLNTSSLYD